MPSYRSAWVTVFNMTWYQKIKAKVGESLVLGCDLHTGEYGFQVRASRMQIFPKWNRDHRPGLTPERPPEPPCRHSHNVMTLSRPASLTFESLTSATDRRALGVTLTVQLAHLVVCRHSLVRSNYDHSASPHAFSSNVHGGGSNGGGTLIPNFPL